MYAASQIKKYKKRSTLNIGETARHNTTAALLEALTTLTKAILIQSLTTHTRPLETSTADPKDSTKQPIPATPSQRETLVA